jgi:spore coat polysaccharide biosynthesis predicted glycosyltransferase SpsG
MPKVLLVCDATPLEGTGHVMRQITLGDALVKHRIDVELFCESIPQSLIDRANSFQIVVERRHSQQSSVEIVDEIFSRDPDFVVIDGYRFHLDTFKKISDLGIPCLVIDDNGDHAEVPCTFILNQNLHAGKGYYKENIYNPVLLLGLSWALVRPEIVEQSQQHRTVENNSVFIALGGSDHLGLSSQIANKMQEEKWETHVAGGFFSSDSMSPREMASHMARSTVGVIACGTTVWEAILLGLPMVGLVTADNQIEVASSLNKYQICNTFDCRETPDVDAIKDAVSVLLASQQTRHSLTDRYKKIIDGFGAERVAKVILGSIASQKS